jgi:hypothetical protein
MVTPVARGFSSRPVCGGSMIFSQEDSAILFISLLGARAKIPRVYGFP